MFSMFVFVYQYEEKKRKKEKTDLISVIEIHSSDRKRQFDVKLLKDYFTSQTN